MSSADVVAVLDLHTARPGQRLFPLTPDQVRVPFGVQVLQINPATVAMVFESSATRPKADRASHCRQPGTWVCGRQDHDRSGDD